MDAQQEKPRRRFSPEKRRSLIIDFTAEVIAKEGVAKLSMERIGREAGVSKSLVYNYFENLTELLRALLERELKTLRRLQFEAVERAETLEEIVRNVTHVYLKYISERGLIIERLQSEPSVSTLSDPTEYSRDAAVSFLAERVADHLHIPYDIAVSMTDISFGIPASAGDYLLRTNADLKETEDLTVSMILGSLLRARNDYFAKAKRAAPAPK
ncbi:MAG: TetR/AcrR family transcriptional regulator [Henriciella sp.]